MIPHSRPTLGPEEHQAVEEVLASGQIAQGKKTALFEKRFCEFTGRRFAVAVSSGTSALHLSLVALGIGRGDEVILPSFTCAALLHALAAVGAKPVLADIDPEDFNLTAAEVKKKIRKKTRAILVPHSFGRAARMEEILSFKIPVIEDGTQALGARVGNQKVGSFGAASIFSFYATKMITTGEGGMVLTDFPRLAERIHDLRDYDKKENFRLRTNSKMTDLEAAMGIEQLKKLESFIESRREIAREYHESLANSPVILPTEDPQRDHVYYRFVVRIRKKSQAWLKELEKRSVEVKRPVYKPLHRYLELSDTSFPETARAMKEACSLPIYPSLAPESRVQISHALQASFAEPKLLKRRLQHVEI